MGNETGAAIDYETPAGAGDVVSSDVQASEQSAAKPTVVAFAPLASDLFLADDLLDEIHASETAPKLHVAHTRDELSEVAGDADHALILISAADRAVYHAALHGAAPSAALDDWIAAARDAVTVCRDLGAKAVLLSPDTADLTSDQANALGFGFPVAVGPNATPDQQDPVAAFIATTVAAASAEATALAVELDTLRPSQDDAPNPVIDGDAALSQHLAGQSRLAELSAEQDAIERQLSRVQDDLKRQAKTVQDGAFLNGFGQGGDLRRQQPLRDALSHQQTVSDFGPLTPRMVTAPFLTRQITNIAEDHLAIIPHFSNADDNSGVNLLTLPSNSSINLLPLLHLNEAARLTKGAIFIGPGESGHQFFGPYLKLAPSRYQLKASVTLFSRRGFKKRKQAVFESVCSGIEQPQKRSINCGLFGKKCQDMTFDFEIPASLPGGDVSEFEARLWTDGKVSLTFETLELRKL